MIEENKPDKDGRARSIANLIPPFKPGQSGNPNGRPKGAKSYKTIIRQFLESKSKFIDEDGKELLLSQFDQIVIAQIQEAKKGSVNHFSALLDRLEGKPMQKVESSTVTKLIASVKPLKDIPPMDNRNEDDDIEDIEHENINDDE